MCVGVGCDLSSKFIKNIMLKYQRVYLICSLLTINILLLERKWFANCQMNRNWFDERNITETDGDFNEVVRVNYKVCKYLRCIRKYLVRLVNNLKMLNLKKNGRAKQDTKLVIISQILASLNDKYLESLVSSNISSWWWGTWDICETSK